MLKNVKTTTHISLLDLIAPHSCRGCGQIGKALCDRCKNNIIANHQDFCPKCKAAKTSNVCHQCHDLPPTFIGGERTGLLANIVHDYKYQSIRSLAHPLADIISSAIPPLGGLVFIVPLPTISRHIRERGFDHTLLLAKYLANIKGANYQVCPILRRRTNSIQVGTKRTTRLHQASQAYRISPHAIINPHATYLLLDDVWTTGASLRAARTLLQQNSITNTAFAILSVSRL